MVNFQEYHELMKQNQRPSSLRLKQACIRSIHVRVRFRVLNVVGSSLLLNYIMQDIDLANPYTTTNKGNKSPDIPKQAIRSIQQTSSNR